MLVQERFMLLFKDRYGDKVHVKALTSKKGAFPESGEKTDVTIEGLPVLPTEHYLFDFHILMS